MVVVVAHRLNVFVCPYIILFHMIITELLVIMVSIIAFPNNVDVKQIYVNKI